jgi:hypothetical protein
MPKLRMLTDEEAAEVLANTEEDIHLDSNGNAYFIGKLIVPAKKEIVREGTKWVATGGTEGPHWQKIREWCKANNWFPNVIAFSDHGNPFIFTTTGRIIH